MTFRKIVLLCLLLSFDALLYAQEDGQYKLSISFLVFKIQEIQ